MVPLVPPDFPWLHLTLCFSCISLLPPDPPWFGLPWLPLVAPWSSLDPPDFTPDIQQALWGPGGLGVWAQALKKRQESEWFRGSPCQHLRDIVV